jgi:CheY-like chemotaxis protein
MPGAGSEFSVRLPLRYGAIQPSTFATATGNPAHAVSSSASKIAQVLIIDDEDLARYLVRKQLSALPVNVKEARSGAEGLELAKSGVEAIVLDVVMPDASGFHILAQLKEDPLTRNIPVVIHTSLTLSGEEREALSQAAAIVSKSRSESELRDVVTLLIANQQ